jgi:excisionase family DNA binding protein
MRIPGGILLGPATCSIIGPHLQDLLAGWRVNGLPTPEDVRREVQEVSELGRRFQAAQLAKHAPDVRQDVRSVANRRSPPAPSVSMTTAQVAAALNVGCRAIQRRANRGSLRATRAPGGELQFDKTDVDRLVKGSSHG